MAGRVVQVGRSIVAGAVIITGCTKPASVPPEGIPDLYAAATGPLLYADTDGCARVHEVWKAQVRAVHETAQLGWRDRENELVAQAYEPFQEFWQGYLGDESDFRRWARGLDLAGDPRRGIPLAANPGQLISDATAEMEALTGRRGCADWYVVYGPGWTNLGGLSSGRMVVDFFGMPETGALENMRAYLPHEVSHVIDGARGGPSAGTLLAAIIGEGFASYVTVQFYGETMSPAEALSYTEQEWTWAVEHEAELWALVEDRLLTRDPEEIRPFRAAGVRPIEGGPGKVGYFLGYRIVQAYVARHGRERWTELYDLDTADILDRSGYDT